MFEKIYNNEFYISKKEVQDLLTPNLLELMKSEVRANFDELMTPERIIMICECLDYRFNKLSLML